MIRFHLEIYNKKQCKLFHQENLVLCYKWNKEKEYYDRIYFCDKKMKFINSKYN